MFTHEGIDMIKSFGRVSFLRACGTLGLNIIQINAFLHLYGSTWTGIYQL